MRTFVLFLLSCAIHVTWADRIRDRQHREWRRKAAASLQEEQPYQTAATSLPSEPSHTLQKRATTGTGVWISTGPTATVIITTARISSRCGAAFGTRTVCPTGASCQSIQAGSSICRSTTVSTSPRASSYVTTGTGVWTSSGPDKTVVVTTARTSARCGAASGTRTVCVPGYTCGLNGATSACRLASTSSSRPPTTTSTRISSTTARSTTSISSLLPTIIPSSSSTSSSTTTSTSVICAPRYTGGATTITGTGTLPKATSFVTRSGTQLMLSGKVYRPVGPNIYWLGLDENVGPYQYPSKQRIREAMAISVAMGANTIRSHTLGISVGVPLSVEPSLNTFNDAAFDIIDYALYAAREYGLRVVIPLTDEHDYYHGGRYTFLRWLGTDQSNFGSQFYTNRTVINTYRTYINRILGRYNQYSKIYYYNDPTILAWETGNELGGYIGRTGYPPLSWTDEIAGFIKSIAKNTLVMDGTNGIWNYTTGATAPGLKSSSVDIMSDHLYPLNNGILNQELGYVQQNNKAFVIGEYDWTGEHGGSSNLTDFLTASEKTSYLGDLPWSVFGHDDQCCAFVPHLDGFSIYYPNGNTAAEQTRILQIVQHNYNLTGRTAPSSLPAVACPQRVF